MKSSRIFSLMIIGLALVLGATGCKKKAVGVTELPNSWRYKTAVTPRGEPDNGLRSATPEAPTSNPTPIPTVNPDGSTPLKASRLLADPNHREDREALKMDTVYFDLDSATVKSSEQSKIQDAAKFINEHKNYELMVEGHCDERGTEGYNLSLGERRALAIRESLIAAGANADQVNTISYGESRPAANGHDESAWKQNRRGEFLVLMPAQ